MADDARPIRLFVVHAGEDRDKARRLRRWLHRHVGVRLVADEDVHPRSGEDPWDAVREEIRQSTGVLFLATPASLDSERTLVELGMVQGMRKPFRWIQTGRIPLRAPVEMDASDSVSFDQLGDPEFADDVLQGLRAAAASA